MKEVIERSIYNALWHYKNTTATNGPDIEKISKIHSDEACRYLKYITVEEHIKRMRFWVTITLVLNIILAFTLL